MSEHTPGPWEVTHLDATGSQSAGYANVRAVNRHMFGHGTCLPIVDVYLYHEPEQQANARLIAAAPDLLAALETARDYVAGELEYRKQAMAGYPDKWRTEEEDLASIDAAIAKARSAS